MMTKCEREDISKKTTTLDNSGKLCLTLPSVNVPVKESLLWHQGWSIAKNHTLSDEK